MSFEAEQAAIARRQKIAEQMMRQGQEPMETNQMAGGYVVPVSPLAGIGKIAQQLAGAYIGKQADNAQSELSSKRVGALVDAVKDGNLDYGRLADAGVDPSAIAKIIVDRQSKQSELDQKLAEKRLELSLPTTTQRDALWAANNNEDKAREIVSQKLQNPLGMLNYQLQAGNVAADNARKNQELELKKQEIALKGRPSEFQQWTMQQKEEAQARDKQDAVANIDDTIAKFEGLKAIQARTPTGPVIGSAPMVAIRKALPDSIGQGTDLQRLEKGYNNLAIQAIGAFKAGGVTFGQLSNKEGEWIKSTQEALNTGTEINKEMLDEGLKLLQQRKERILAKSNASKMPESAGNVNVNIRPEEWAAMTPEQQQALQADIAREKAKPDPFAGFTPELKAQFLKEHPEYGR